jgi:hypothetical protein
MAVKGVNEVVAELRKISKGTIHERNQFFNRKFSHYHRII